MLLFVDCAKIAEARLISIFYNIFLENFGHLGRQR